jgi:hypothetical protein
MSTNNKHVSGIGERKVEDVGGGGRIFKVWIKIQLNYNLTNVILPINLQTYNLTNVILPINLQTPQT